MFPCHSHQSMVHPAAQIVGMRVGAAVIVTVKLHARILTRMGIADSPMIQNADTRATVVMSLGIAVTG